MCKKPFCCICFILLVVGALNWGLIGAFNYNLVESLLGAWPVLVTIVYLLVGIAGLLALVKLAKCGGRCVSCAGGGAPSGGMPS